MHVYIYLFAIPNAFAIQRKKVDPSKNAGCYSSLIPASAQYKSSHYRLNNTLSKIRFSFIFKFIQIPMQYKYAIQYKLQTEQFSIQIE